MDKARLPKLRSQPLYLQAIDALENLIANQVYKPGDMLPPEDALARQLGISRLTLREAMGYLENDRIIERRRGVGTFVLPRNRQHIWGGLERLESLRSLAQIAGLDAETVAREVSLAPAQPDWAGKLDVEGGSELVRLTVTKAANGNKVGLVDSLIPASRVDMDDIRDHGGTLLEYLLERGRVAPATTHSEVYAVNADEWLSSQLETRLDQALLHLVETYYTSNGEPIAMSLNYFLTDHFNFYINRRVVGRPRRTDEQA